MDQKVEGLKYTPVKEYTTFTAEYTMLNGDIVIHFFLPEEVDHLKNANTFWKTKFPEVLDFFSRSFWEADYPRLQAAYTPELNSWWMRCFGFANIGDPEARAKKFFEGLDAELEK
jgi:hypothetical protein